MSVLLVPSEFLKQMKETRKVPYSTTFVDHTKHPSVKNNFQAGHLKEILAGKGAGDFKLSNLQLFDLGFRIKVLQGQFHFVFYRGFLSN